MVMLESRGNAHDGQDEVDAVRFLLVGFLTVVDPAPAASDPEQSLSA